MPSLREAIPKLVIATKSGLLSWSRDKEGKSFRCDVDGDTFYINHTSSMDHEADYLNLEYHHNGKKSAYLQGLFYYQSGKTPDYELLDGLYSAAMASATGADQALDQLLSKLL